MSDLLARFAESAFWLARYLERAENLARVIDVNESLAQESRVAEAWLPIIQINADGERFSAKHTAATAEAVTEFYILDGDNPNSIVSSIRMARENARMLRHLISTEMWTHINVFHNELSELTPSDLRMDKLSALCSQIKLHCQTHAGITEGTLYRDQVHSFHELGKCLERADQMTRLLDIKYHHLLPSSDLVGSPIDAGQWNALLRSAAGYHAFRRAHPRGLNPATVAGFLLYSRLFPRSVFVSLDLACDHIEDLTTRFDLVGGGAAAALRKLRGGLRAADIGEVIAGGLHEYLDALQCRIIAITGELGRDYFGQGGGGRRCAGAGPMSTRLTVKHTTIYRYARPVLFNEHRLMLRPRDSHDLRLLSTTLSISPEPQVRWLHDVFGNSIAIATFTESADTLRFESTFTVEHFGAELPDFPIETYARSVPFSYSQDEIPDLGRTIERHYPDPKHKVDAWVRRFLSPDGWTETDALLVNMTRSIKQNFAYYVHEDQTQEPTVTLERMAGTCRDFALLLMEAARSLGMAARFVSGYLYDPGLDDSGPGMVGAGATHAWAQIYLPGSGWVEFDPTNGLVGGPNLIRVAVARDPTQAIPVQGSYTGAAADFLDMSVEVTVTADPVS